MKANPQSLLAVETLLSGGVLTSGDLSIGPLNESAIKLLRVLVEYYDNLHVRSGADQVHALRQAYIAALVCPPAAVLEQDEAPPSSASTGVVAVALVSAT